MNCCNNNHDGHKQEPRKSSGHLKHILMMVLCCGAPLLLVSLLPAISAAIPGSENVLRTITPFLCPILMIGMIPMMLKEWKGSQADGKKAVQAEESSPNQISRQSGPDNNQ